MDIQGRHDVIWSEIITQGDTIPCDGIEVDGKIDLSSSLVMHPVVKLKSNSPTLLDFSALTSGTAITYNAQVPEIPEGETASAEHTYNYTGFHAANLGATINGTMGGICVKGNDKNGNVIGLKIGNSLKVGDRSSCRDVTLESVVVDNFGVGVEFLGKDTYLSGLRNSRINACTTALAFTETNAENSGERMFLDNIVFGSCHQGIYHNSQADVNVINSSIDFCNQSALKFGADAGYSYVSFTDVHFEGCNNNAIIESDMLDYNHVYVSVKGAKIVPTNGGLTTEELENMGAMPDGTSLPRTELFKGKYTLTLNDLVVSYAHPAHDAENGLFMVADEVKLSEAKNIHFTGWRQAIARSKVVNYNWNFDEEMTGSQQDGWDLKGWNFNSSRNITADNETGIVFKDSNNSIKLECTDGASNWFVLSTDHFDVKAGDKLINQHVVYGGTSTGDIRVQARIYQYHVDPASGSETELAVSSPMGSDFEDLYNDANDPTYNAGARDRWLKEKDLHYIEVVEGANRAKLEITVSTMATGDVIYLGGALINKV